MLISTGELAIATGHAMQIFIVRIIIVRIIIVRIIIVRIIIVRIIIFIVRLVEVSCYNSSSCIYNISRLDYGNSSYYGLPKRLIQKRQSVQNSAARLVNLSKRYEHISPILRELNWLPVE